MQKNDGDGWKGFLQMSSKAGSKEMLDLLYDLLLTHEEKEHVASRYLIIKALLEGKLTQREIAENFQVSIAQITRGSNYLKRIDPKLKEFLKKQC